MSETNGHDANAEGMSRILLLNGAKGPKHALTRAQRAEVEKLASDIVIQECAKVHAFYLDQIPPFVANMIVDALVDRKLIPEFRTGPTSSEGAGIGMDNTALPQSGDVTAPDTHSPSSDSIAAAEGPSGLIPPPEPAA